MKKKLLIYILSTMAFSLFAVTLLFLSMVNYEYEQNIKGNLKNFNEIIENISNYNNKIDAAKIFQKTYSKLYLGVTVIDRNNHVILNSEKDLMIKYNISDFYEVEQAKKLGEGYTIRYSSKLNKDIMYYASYKGGYIIRTSETLDLAGNLDVKYLSYYLLMLVITIVITLWFDLKLSKFIIKPIKDLEFATSCLSKGELQKRVRVESNDELGHLGENFNNMAEQLQIVTKDSLIKKNRMEAILKSMDSGVIAVDRKNRLILINPYAEKLFGINRNIIGERLMDNIRDFELENIFHENTSGFNEVKILWPKEKILE